jgi:hypothetical protein
MTAINRNNLIGAVLANVINISSILVFVFRLLEKPVISHWTGIILELCIFPLVYLIYTARRFSRSKIYYIWIGLMIAFVIVEFLLDWYPGIDFRDNLAIVIPYVMLFFGSTGGMIGVARLAGKRWAVFTIITCLVMFILAFVQRQVTGM